MALVFGIQLLAIALALVVLVLWGLWRFLHARPRHVWATAEVLGGVVVGSLSRDRWGEVFDTIWRNKLRTALTAVSVAWGICVLVVLLGMGNGLNKGVRSMFRREAQNGVWVIANKTTVPAAGYGIGRRIVFENRDFEEAKQVAGIDHISGQFFIPNSGAMKVSRGTKSNAFQVNAVHPDAIHLRTHEVIAGRFLNDGDILGKRKVVVVGRPVRDFLFDGEDPVGQWLDIGSVAFQVIGVYTDDAGEENERQIYIPVSTAQLAFNGADKLGMLMFTVGNANAAEAKRIADEVVGQLARAHQFAPEDKQAVQVFNNAEGFGRFNQFFMVISVFVVVIGLGSLAAGVVGVSNIMMISVRERTKEIGIRKALGATPSAIIAMIVQEAVFLTAVAGLLGLAFGVAILEVLPIDPDMVKDPSIDIRIGIMAAVALMIAGALAGFVPARTAARVNPVHTLRDQ